MMGPGGSQGGDTGSNPVGGATKPQVRGPVRRASQRFRDGGGEVRMFLARLLGIGEHQVRVLMRDTGGGFGQKVARCARTCASHWRRCSFRSR
jgi:Molybdopterin cofactor-binding domain